MSRSIQNWSLVQHPCSNKAGEDRHSLHIRGRTPTGTNMITASLVAVRTVTSTTCEVESYTGSRHLLEISGLASGQKVAKSIHRAIEQSGHNQ
jgi:hypothetical protein